MHEWKKKDKQKRQSGSSMFSVILSRLPVSLIGSVGLSLSRIPIQQGQEPQGLIAMNESTLTMIINIYDLMHP